VRLLAVLLAGFAAAVLPAATAVAAPPSATAVAAPPSATATAAPPTAPADAALRPFDAATPAALRQAHAGRPWVLVLWSVSCEPCRAELAHWTRWRRQRPDVAIELVATDSPEEAPLAQRLLAHAGLDGAAGAGRQWIFADDYAERLRHAIDPAWHGEVPRSYFFDSEAGIVARSGVVDAGWLHDWYARRPARR
jgi:hypothetical protein